MRFIFIECTVKTELFIMSSPLRRNYVCGWERFPSTGFADFRKNHDNFVGWLLNGMHWGP